MAHEGIRITEEGDVEIDTASSMNQKVYAFSFVNDNQSKKGLALDITVCGKESLESANPSPVKSEYNFNKSSSSDTTTIISFLEI